MKIEYIREFMDLAETLNYSASSGRLYISQPTLTRHIQAMEKEIGSPLVVTSSHGVELTREGSLAVSVFRKILKEYDRYLEQCTNLSSHVSGTLKLGLLYYAIDEHFSSFLDYLSDKYPRLELCLSSYQPQQLYEDILSGKVDAGTLFCYEKDLDPDLRFCRATDQRFIAMMGSNHALASAETVTLQELSFSRLIELKGDEFSRNLTRKMLARNNIRFSGSIFTENIDTVPMTIRKAGGVHITGESCRNQHASDICYKSISGQRTTCAFGFMSRASSDDPLVDLLFRETRSYFKDRSI